MAHKTYKLLDNTDFYTAEATDEKIAEAKAELLEKINKLMNDVAELKAQLDKKQNKVYYQETEPTGAVEGDIWVYQGDKESGLFYEHSQSFASDVWTIKHNLGYNPSIIAMDSANNQIEGVISYVDKNTATLTFCHTVAGTAFCS